MAAHTTTCHICGSTFTPKSANAKYCSPECRKEAKRKADREFMRKWRAENPEKNAERRKREDPELHKQRTLRWREQHPKKAKAQAKAYRQANRASETARMRRWLEDPEHKERHYANIKRWAIRNPDKVAACRVRRARAELEGNATRELINAKWESSDKTCCLCGTRIDDTLSSPHPMSPTLEHLTPISRGGTHNLDNIDFAHRACNTKKGPKTLDEFREWMKRTA
nr:MAG TPA: HNH endonuclease [Bacteriophage sp.]